MCGIFYSSKNTYNENYNFINVARRGPEKHREVHNELGHFKHYKLSTTSGSQQPFVTDKGVLLYNGSVYNEQDDTKYIAQSLNSDVNDCIETVRDLRGEYAFVWVTDKFYLLATDPFRNRQLWIHYTDSLVEVASLPDIFRQNNKHCWPLPANTICVIDKKSMGLRLRKNRIWNLDQTVSSYDKLIESFEKSVLQRTSHKTCLPLSSGYDSGTIAAIWHKNKLSNPVVFDTSTENEDVITRRKHQHSIFYELNYSNADKDINSINQIHTSVAMKGSRMSSLIALCHLMNKNNLVSMMSGDGGDEIYSDYGYDGKQGYLWSFFGGSFPQHLELVWPPPSNHLILDYTHRLDTVTGYYGVESRNPFLDIDVVQNWLNTSVKLKNYGYKQWMNEIMASVNYPFAPNEKIAFSKHTRKMV